MNAHYFYVNFRRKTRERPVAAALGGLAVTSLVLSAGLAATGLTLWAQLIGGLALVPITVAIWLCLIPAAGWFDDGHGRGGRGDDPPDGPIPGPAGTPNQGVDWTAFEREFWAYVECGGRTYSS
jgi:hypothetical protein